MENYKVAIIGAGASGLMASSILAEKGIKTILIEKNTNIGRKILSTGAGKCNISNSNINTDCYNCLDLEKLKIILSKVSLTDILNFFKYKLGIITFSDEKGRIFPISQKAESVPLAFEIFLKNKSVEIMTLTEVISISNKNDYFEIKCRHIPADWQKKELKSEIFTIKSEKLILACGGPSYPRIGGTFSGFEIAKILSHTIREIRPIITPLLVTKPDLSLLNGIRVNAKTQISINNKKEIIQGELLFTNYGISGPFALDISFATSHFKEIPYLNIELIPEISENELLDFLKKRINKNNSIYEIIAPAIDRKLAIFILKELKINYDTKADYQLIKKISHKLKNFEIFSLKPKSFDMAMSKIGGIPFDEINENFESKKIKNLFIVGEMLDCAGKSGGYNLHFAWISGYIAGKSIF